MRQLCKTKQDAASRGVVNGLVQVWDKKGHGATFQQMAKHLISQKEKASG